MAVPMCTVQYKHVAENLSPLCFLATAPDSVEPTTPPKKNERQGSLRPDLTQVICHKKR